MPLLGSDKVTASCCNLFYMVTCIIYLDFNNYGSVYGPLMRANIFCLEITTLKNDYHNYTN